MDQLPVHWEIFWPDMSSVPDWLSLTATMSTLFSSTSMVTVTQDLPGEEAPRFSFVSVKINVSFMFNYWGSSLYQSRYMYHWWFMFNYWQIESLWHTVYMYFAYLLSQPNFLGSHLPNYITDPPYFINSSPFIIISGKVTLL